MKDNTKKGLVEIRKVMILSVPESDEEIFDKILNVIKDTGNSDVTEVKVNDKQKIQM